MGQGQLPRGLLCPVCGTGLEPLPNGTPAPDSHRMICSNCGEIFRARRKGPGTTAGPGYDASGTPPMPPPVGSLALYWRGAALQAVEWAYHAGAFSLSALLLAFGGFVPVIRAWLRDEIANWGGVLEALGGVRVVTETKDPDADIGPVLARTDAPLLFSSVGEVARRLGVKPPGQIRLTYLPCCGVVSWGRSHALILGLPLLRVLTLSEFRAVIAHELAHLARGDATRAARSARFVEGLRQGLDRVGGRGRGPLGAWARACSKASGWLLGPIAWGQEARADRSSAAIAGGTAAASALVKVAMVQPLFREVLGHYDPTASDDANLYAFFRTFWFRLPTDVHSAVRLRILTDPGEVDPAHPPLPDRLALLQAYPDPVQAPTNPAESSPATSFLGDLEAFEQMLHNRLFGLPPVEPSVFHRTGT